MIIVNLFRITGVLFMCLYNSLTYHYLIIYVTVILMHFVFEECKVTN